MFYATPRTSAIALLNYPWLAGEDKASKIVNAEESMKRDIYNHGFEAGLASVSSKKEDTVEPVNTTDKWIERKPKQGVPTPRVSFANAERITKNITIDMHSFTFKEADEMLKKARADLRDKKAKERDIRLDAELKDLCEVYGMPLPAGHPAKEVSTDETQRTFSTGAVRDTDKDKPRMDLIPPEALEALGHVLAEGAKHYGVRNWEKGIPLSEFMASGERHRCKVMRCEHDEDHDRRWFWNVMAFIVTAERIRAGKLPAELDDIGWTKEEK